MKLFRRKENKVCEV